METREIKEPIRGNLYWANYWKTMNEKLGNNHFNEVARQLKWKITKDSKKIVAYTNDCNIPMEKGLTDDDEEALKILNAILGESAQ